MDYNNHYWIIIIITGLHYNLIIIIHGLILIRLSCNNVHCLCFIALFLRFIAVVMPCDIVHVTQHCTLLVLVALFLRFIAVVMPCDIVHVTQHCTLLMFHCIVFTLYSGCYALWHCSCYTTLYIAYVSLHCFYAL